MNNTLTKEQLEAIERFKASEGYKRLKELFAKSEKK
jgi:hypothetical protein